jgi:hypothetical protein
MPVTIAGRGYVRSASSRFSHEAASGCAPPPVARRPGASAIRRPCRGCPSGRHARRRSTNARRARPGIWGSSAARTVASSAAGLAPGAHARTAASRWLSPTCSSSTSRKEVSSLQHP